MLNLRTSKNPGWLALSLGDGQLACVHVARSPAGKPALHWVQVATGEAGGNSDSLHRLRRAQRMERYRCTLLLAPGQYQLVQTEMPAVAAEDACEALRWRLKDMVDFPVDRAAIDLLPVPATGAGRAPAAFAVAAAADVIESLVQRCQRARLPLSVIDIPELAQRNIATLFEQDERALALLNFGSHGGLLTFTSGGELYTFRRIEITAAQLAAADPERQQQLFERISLELQRSIDNFDRSFGGLPLGRLLLAPNPAAPALQNYLRDFLYVPVELADLTTVIDYSAAPESADPERQSAQLELIGAALRMDAA